MARWTEEEAKKCITKNVGERKVIYLDGNCSLRQNSAMDYLVNHCGYQFGEKKVEEK